MIDELKAPERRIQRGMQQHLQTVFRSTQRFQRFYLQICLFFASNERMFLVYRTNPHSP